MAMSTPAPRCTCGHTEAQHESWQGIPASGRYIGKCLARWCACQCYTPQTAARRVGPSVTPQEVWRIQKIKIGYCPRCGQKNADLRFRDCPPCRDRVNARRREVRAKSRRVS
jgi:hypothetical protein